MKKQGTQQTKFVIFTWLKILMLSFWNRGENGQQTKQDLIDSFHGLITPTHWVILDIPARYRVYPA